VGPASQSDLRREREIFSGKDEDEDATSSVDLFRLGVGSRAWFRTGADFIPFAGASFNYYVLDVGDGNNPEGMFGVSAEAGVAYIMDEWVAIEVSLHGETSLNNGYVDIKDRNEDVSLHGVGLGIGVTVLF
jgi:hypothetical protein